MMTFVGEPIIISSTIRVVEGDTGDVGQRDGYYVFFPHGCNYGVYCEKSQIKELASNGTQFNPPYIHVLLQGR